MKIFAIIFAISLFSVASAQNCSVADYSNVTAIITALVASLNQTNNLTNQIAPQYLYEGYQLYWQNDSDFNLNVYSNNFSAMAANNTNALLTILKGLMLAINNQSTMSNQSLINLGMLISMTNISIIPFSDDGAGYATALSNDINTMLQNLLGFITNLFANTVQLSYAGLPPTASNIMKVLPSSLLVQGLIKSLQNRTNEYIKYMNTSASNIKKLYDLIKKSQSLIVSFDLMENQTYYNWSLATNATQNLLSSAIVNFTKQVNTMYKNFTVLLPAALNASNNILPFAESIMTEFNSSLQDFKDELSIPFQNILMSIDNYDQLYFSKILLSLIDYYRQIMLVYVTNSTTLKCTIDLINETEAMWKAYGGPKNFFNCTVNENGLLPKFQPMLQVLFATISQDLNATYGDFQKCLFIKPILADGINYSMEQCLTIMSQMLSGSILRDYGTSFMQLIQTMLTGANTRLDTCVMETLTGLSSYFQPIINKYYACISAILNT